MKIKFLSCGVNILGLFPGLSTFSFQSSLFSPNSAGPDGIASNKDVQLDGHRGDIQDEHTEYVWYLQLIQVILEKNRH